MKALTIPGSSPAILARDARATAAAALGQRNTAFEQLAELTAEHVPMIALLADRYPAVWSYADPNEPATPWVTVFTSVGQLSWPVAREDMEMFEHVPFRNGANWIHRTPRQRLIMLRALAERVADDSSMLDAVEALL